MCIEHLYSPDACGIGLALDQSVHLLLGQFLNTQRVSLVIIHGIFYI